MKNFIFSVVLILVLPLGGFSTHIVGGEVYYDCLGNNQYRITLKVYRDCSSNNTNQTPFDDPATIAIYQGGILSQTLSIPIQTIVPVPTVINDPCLQAPPNLCIEQATYITTTILTPSLVGYDIVYQRCCRNPSVINLFNSSNFGTTLYAQIPPSGTANCNSSPRFQNLPPLVICNGSNFTFDHSAIDPDGDLLTYSFYTPMDGGDQFNPAPIPPSPPPFTSLVWNTGFSVNNQISGSPSLGIDPSTGELFCNPNLNGLYVFGIKVTESRNGVILSESFREFQTTVTSCPSIVVSSIPLQTDLCSGPTVNFGNNSQNAISYLWDFGVQNIQSDTSNLLSPTYTYADTGNYTITLIANPGFSCADTAYQTYDVRLPLDPVISPQNPQCIDVNSFDFGATGNFDLQADYNWTFGNTASLSFSNTAQPVEISYSAAGVFPVTLTISQYNCTATVTDSVTVFPLPQLIFSMEPDTGCAPFSVQLEDQSTAWGSISRFWDLGDGTTSTLTSPINTYFNPGSYDITLTISVDSVCIRTETLFLQDFIVVHPTPVASIFGDPLESDIFNPNFTFYNNSQGETSFSISIGDQSAENTSPFPATLFDSGEHTAMIIATNDFGCSDTSYTTVFVAPFTSIYVLNAFSPNGDGRNDEFVPIVYDVNSYHFRIFNRWGEVFFESTTLREGWDGTRNGRLASNDTYIYQINYKDWKDIDRVVSGHFTLIR